MADLIPRTTSEQLRWRVGLEDFVLAAGSLVWQVPPSRQTAEQRKLCAAQRNRGVFGVRDAVVLVAPWDPDDWTTVSASCLARR